MRISRELQTNCRKTPERLAWLSQLPGTVRELERRWALKPDSPLGSEEPTCSLVSAVRLADGSPAVLKIAMPHMEGEHEIQGLRFWRGDPTVRLLAADDELGAMLLERCNPGTVLRTLPEHEQDPVIASLLQRLWRSPSTPHPFRPLAALLDHWSKETLVQAEHWTDAGIVREGLLLFQELPRTAAKDVLLATDLHAGNILRAERESWLVVDPKPFVGDPAYDATQHLFNCRARLRSDPAGMIRSLADLIGIDRDRVRLWTFARAAAEPRDDWANNDLVQIARAIAP